MPRATLQSELSTLTSIIIDIINSKGIALRRIAHKEIEKRLGISTHRCQFLITIARLDKNIYYHDESDSYTLSKPVNLNGMPVFASQTRKEVKQLIEAIYSQKLMVGIAKKDRVFDVLKKRYKCSLQHYEFLINLGLLEGVIKYNESNDTYDITI